MNGAVGLSMAVALALVVLLGVGVLVCRYRAAARQRRAFRRQRDIEQATRMATRRVQAHYQKAGWMAVQQVIGRYGGHPRQR